jgi:hypothetical protein
MSIEIMAPAKHPFWLRLEPKSAAVLAALGFFIAIFLIELAVIVLAAPALSPGQITVT